MKDSKSWVRQIDLSENPPQTQAMHGFKPSFWRSLIVLAIAQFPSIASAQILPDATLPNHSIVTPNGSLNEITGGTAAGGNLFHSFEQFNVPTGSEAFFNNPLTIDNIITRVTGGSISNIDGLIRANGTANLFLLNPSGILFGPNARLDIGGSFFGSTADSLLFEDGSVYSATEPNASGADTEVSGAGMGTPPLLTMSVPIGLQLGPNPGAIRVEGSGHNLTQASLLSPIVRGENDVGLRVNPGNTLALVGGDVTLDGGILTAEQGRIELWSVTSGQLFRVGGNGEWTIASNGQATEFGQIQLQQAALADVSGTPGGSLQLGGGQVSLRDGSLIFAENYGQQPFGSIRVRASESLELSGTTPDGRIRSGLGYQNWGAGDGGDIKISTRQLGVRDGAFICAAAIGPGSGGHVIIDAPILIEARGFSAMNPGLTSTIGTSTIGAGPAGNVNLSTGRLRLLDGGTVTAITAGSGASGDVTVHATESIEAIGVEPTLFSPSTLSIASLNVGDAGNLTINTSRLILRDGGRVTSSTLAIGSAGSITIQASELVEVSGTVPGSVNPSLIDSSANLVDLSLQQLLGLPPTPSGDAGNVTIHTPILRVLDGGLVNVRNDGSGNAGGLSVNADEIVLEDGGGIVATTQSGDGGNISLQIREGLEMHRQAQISATAGGTGNGGNITIDVETIVALENSDITANAGQGRGGQVSLTAQGLFGIAIRDTLTPESDITATSELGVEFSGGVSLNTPNRDPVSGLLEWPDTPIDVTALIGQDPCSMSRGSELIVTGRGGLPPNPREALRMEGVRVNPISLNPDAEPRPMTDLSAEDHLSDPQDPSPTADSFTGEHLSDPQDPRNHRRVEAQGWVIGPNGEVILTAYSPTVTPYSLGPRRKTCRLFD